MMKRPALAMLLDSAPQNWSSIEELHLQFSRALIARGFQPVVVFSRPLPPELANRFQAIGVKVEAINYANGIFHYYRKLGKLIKNHSVSAVHIAYFNYFDATSWLARLRGVSQIVFLEGNSGLLRATSWKKRMIRLRTRIVTMPVKKVLAISEFIRRQLVDAGIPEKKVCLAYHGVDTKRFSPNPSAREHWRVSFDVGPEEVILTSIAHLRPFKHPEVIVKAFGMLAERGVKARLFMAGRGEMWRELDQLARSLGIGERIHWLGDCNNPESLLQASDIFLLASVGEAFGLVLTEAMACAVPVVASRSGAIPEIVEDGETGFLATPLDAASFADAIERLARDEELRREMGQRGRERVRRYFTAEASIQKLMAAYESVFRC